MAKISTAQELENMGEIYKVRTQIFNSISEAEHFVKDRYEFCFHTLKHFDFPDLDIEDKTSIEKAAMQVVKLIGMEKSSLDSIGIQDDPRLFDPINRYMHYFLEYDTLPGLEKEFLENLVNDDLYTINTWIAEYETKHPFLLSGEKPRNHGQKTIKDFYYRCKEEKQTITNYLTNGLKERALVRAGAHKHLDSVMAMFQDYYDRPYKLPIPDSKRHFKSQYIDLVSHRIGPLPIKEGRILKGLYEADKKKFYEEVEKKLPAVKLLDFMQNAINWLPNINPKRIDVFIELKYLYINKKYLGFYALGVPQIEGLFLDMCKLCIPNFSHPYDSLPDKVNFLRPFYKQSDSVLDYFQYHIPNQRNSFLHYGTPDKEDIEILCNDLLFDLVEVLEIFTTLDSETIWLNRLVKKPDITEFSTIGSFTFYFDLVSKVKKCQNYHYFESLVDNLKRNFFPDLILSVTQDLGDKLNGLQSNINNNYIEWTKDSNFVVDLATISNEEIKNNSATIKASLSELTNWRLRSEVEEVLEINNFLKSYKKYIDVGYLKSGLEAHIDTTLSSFNSFLTKIKLISMITEFEK